MIAFDTNVLVRLVVEDDRGQFGQANRWLRRCEDEGEPCLIKILVLCESLWVLKRLYKASRFELALLVETLLTDDTHLPRERVSEIWSHVGNLPIEYHGLSDLPRVVAIATELGDKKAFDAAYLALGERLNAPLWTLNRGIRRRASRLGFQVHVVE